MFSWFKDWAEGIRPESDWKVSMQNETIRITAPDKKVRSIGTDDLTGVAIETNDSGPWGADVWWLMYGRDDQLEYFFPQGATVEGRVLEYLFALSEFDGEQFGLAMRSTQNAVFPVWGKVGK